MQLTKGAIGNLINRYKAVLKKCHLMNTFGSLAVAGMLVMGGAGVAVAESAEDFSNKEITGETLNSDASYLMGGYIQSSGKKLDEAKFLKNTITHTGNYLQGGIIKRSSYAPELSITNSEFSGNSVSTTGYLQGGIINHDVNEKTTNITKSKFNDNIISTTGHYLQGGIINNNGGTININGSEFNNNDMTSPSYLQGGIINNNGTGESVVVGIQNAKFNDNTINSNGFVQGGIIINDSISGTSSINIVKSEFANNKINSQGSVTGGIILNDCLNDGDYIIAIDNTVFSKNEIHSEGNLSGSIINNQEDHKVTINSSSFESNISTVKGDYALGGAIYNKGELTFTGNNTFTDNIVNDKPNDIYNAGTITVKDGTTTLNSGLILAADSTTDVQGGALVVSGSTTWKAESAKMSLTNGALTLQKNDVLNGYEKLADQLTNKEQLTLQSGTLYLITDQDYTLDELTKAQTTLGIDSEKTFLGFQGGKLVDDQQSSKLQVNATNGTITGASNIQVGESAYTGVNTTLVESDLNVDAGSNTTVTITDNADVKVNSVDISTTADAAASVVIEGNPGTGSLTVVGNGVEDDLVTSKNALADITVKNGGTFNMGIEGNSQAQGGQVGKVTVDGGTFNITGTAGQQSDYTVGELVLNDGLVNISNTSNAHSNSSTFNGGMLFLDPSYKATATNAPVQTILAIGEGSTLNVGFMDKATLRQAMINAGLAPNADLTVADTQSVLALGQSITLQGAGQIVLDDEVTPVVTASGDYEAHLPSGKVTDTAYFGDDSLLVVDGTKLGNNAAITASNGTAVIKDGAKLQIVNATKGDVTILNGFTGTSGITIGTGWGKDTSVANPDRMLSSTLKVDDTAGSVTITNGVNRASDVLPGLDSDLDPVMASVWDNSLNDVNSDAMGVRFLSRAANSGYIADAGKAAATIESVARIAFAGAVPQMTKMASDAATNAVVNRLGFANPADGAQAMNAEGQIVDRNTTGFALWIAPLWQSQHGWGMEAGNMDYGFNGNLGGVSLGADYTFENAIRAGITFNIGGGYAESSGGDLSSTDNRMNFWGLGAYAGWNYENFGLMADVSYTSTWNQLKQDLDSRLGMGNELEADVQATAISAGLRAEYLLQTSALDIIPHIGVRYMSLNTWGYDVEANGGNVLEGDGFHQDIWTFPVGVTFTKDFTLDSGWSFKPSIDFSVIPAAGDIKAKQDVRFTGAPVGAELETQMMDYLTWQGGVGLELGNDTMSFGVNYTLQAGQHTTGHGVFGSFRYEF